ncbi:hypothetical protein LCGC14_2436120 [marine sediment metagenome]|uniref:Uncharacterized protein n=1 Tax=marine sediment metagenome TaxID=412755 RepID=A0A0F9EEF3_9ZZZZ
MFLQGDDRFGDELAALLNKHGVDSYIGMRDFLLAEYVVYQLAVLEKLVTKTQGLDNV